MDVLASTDEPLYAAEIGRRAGINASPVLRRLDDAGITTSTKEERIDALRAGRVARRYYHLTDHGRRWHRQLSDNDPDNPATVTGSAAA